MIETSEKYKRLFEEGAVQEYRLIIDDKEYNREDIYDLIEVSQKLFDKETLSVGGFPVGELNTKLKVDSKEIPANAKVKFEYRYVNDEEQSEWIKKFQGNIVKRDIPQDGVTSITAFDRAANYDVFLDYFNDSISSYPANARTVVNLIAGHLGLQVDNINNVINQNIVEFPNVMTMVEVLQNIAAASGGNFTITEDDKLRMVVVKNRNLIKNDFSDFNAYQGAVVTRNKTFPIEVFKGGRNLNVGYTSGFSGMNGDITRIDNTATLKPNGLNNYNAVRFQYDFAQEQGQYTLSFKAKGNINIRVGGFANLVTVDKRYDLVEDKWTFCNITFNKNVDINGIIRIYMDSQANPLSFVDIKEIKLEKGSTATEYSPAPEDGYGLDLPNGAYHITTEGGEHSIKYQYAKSNTGDNTPVTKVTTHTFNEMRIFNGNVQKILPLNETYIYDELDGNRGRIDFQFRTVNNVNVDLPLDFIASDPFIGLAIPEYRTAPPIAHEPINAITKVTVYHEDEKAFVAGEDGGSDITIHNPWGTQQSTNHILSVLKDYKYKPIKSDKVFADPAIQLGDTISYGDNQEQLIAKAHWKFDGSVIASFEAPISNDDNLDDPFGFLQRQEFKKKVSLGNPYQGVTISREKGIEMLMSPDGTETNAIGRFYADLQRGMAFQYRNVISEEWKDWLYFDVTDKVFKLALYTTTEDMDDKFASIEVNLDGIKQEVDNIHLGNIIKNPVGKFNYSNWTGSGQLLAVSDLIAYEDLTVGMPAMPTVVPYSDSHNGWDFFTTGKMTSDFAYTIPNSDYSFRARIDYFKPFTLTLYEYKQDQTANGASTVRNWTSATNVVSDTFKLRSGTMYIKIAIEFKNVTPTSRAQISDIMFNKGLPKKWFESAEDSVEATRTLREQTAQGFRDQVIVNGELRVDIQANKDGLSVEANKISLLAEDIHNTMVDITGTNGVVIQSSGGKGLTVKDSGGTDVISLRTNGTLRAINAEFVNATITGNLNAGTIANMNFDATGITFPQGDLKLNSATNSIDFGSTKMKFTRTPLTVDGSTVYSDDVAIQLGYGEVVIGNFTDFVGNIATTIRGLDIITTKGMVAVNPVDGLQIGSPQGTSPIYMGPYWWFGNATLEPKVTNYNWIGRSNLRIQRIYLNEQPNVGSDFRYKSNILPLDEEFVRILGSDIEARSFTVNGPADDKIHIGYVAQDIQRAIYKYTYKKYGRYRAMEEIERFAMIQKDESYMSLLYGEIAVLMTHYNKLCIQDLQKQLTQYNRPRTSSLT